MSTRERVLARVSLGGRLSPVSVPSDGATTLRVGVSEVGVSEVGVSEVGVSEASRPDGGARERVPLDDYRRAEPDPLHLGAAEQLQHLAAHHPEAIEILTRLFPAQALIGVTRVIPLALDRYGIVLRVERVRGHRDVRLSFRRRVDGGAEAAAELQYLLQRGRHARWCRP